MKELQTGQHRKLSIFYQYACSSRRQAYAIECRAHRILKDNMLEGEWFSVGPQVARLAVERASVDVIEEMHRQKESMKDVQGYTQPEWVEAPPWVKDTFDAVSLVSPLEIAGEKKEYLVHTCDSVIFVGCRKAPKNGEVLSFANDVTRWYIREEAA